MASSISAGAAGRRLSFFPFFVVAPHPGETGDAPRQCAVISHSQSRVCVGVDRTRRIGGKKEAAAGGSEGFSVNDASSDATRWNPNVTTEKPKVSFVAAPIDQFGSRVSVRAVCQTAKDVLDSSCDVNLDSLPFVIIAVCGLLT